MKKKISKIFSMVLVMSIIFTSFAVPAINAENSTGDVLGWFFDYEYSTANNNVAYDGKLEFTAVPGLSAQELTTEDGESTWKITSNTSGSPYRIGGSNYSNITQSDKVTWYCFRIKYKNDFPKEEAFTIGDSAGNWKALFAVERTAAGKARLRIGGREAASSYYGLGYVIDDNLALNTWYDLAIAIDGKTLIDGEKMVYAFLNGELKSHDRTDIFNGATTSAKNVDDLKAIEWDTSGNSDCEAVKYIDSVKLFQTNTPVLGYTITKQDEADDSFTIKNAVIDVNAGMTLSEFKEKVNAASEMKFTDNSGNEVVDDTAPVTGLKLTLTNPSGVALKQYDIETRTIENTYLDFNIDTVWNQQSSDAMMNYNRVAGSANATIIKNDNIKTKPYAKLGMTSMFVARATSENCGTKDMTNRVLWYETSIKFDKNLATFDVRFEGPTACLLYISDDGTLTVGGMPGIAAYGNGYSYDEKLELGRWYHIVLAVDNIDWYYAANINQECGRVYAWVNGKKISDAEFVSPLFRTSTQFEGITNYYNVTNKDTEISIGDTKMYTSYYPVKNNENELCFNPMAIFENATITSETLPIIGEAIYADASSTVNDVLSALNGAAYCYDGAAAVEDTSVNAIGKAIYVPSSNGVGVRKYVIKNNSDSVDRANEKLTVINNGKTSVVYELPYVNLNGNYNDAIIILTAYKNGVLCESKICKNEFKTGVAATSVVWDLENADGYEIRAFSWKSLTTMKPLV